MSEEYNNQIVKQTQTQNAQSDPFVPTSSDGDGISLLALALDIEFPYTGIFGPGGLVSIQNQLQNQNQSTPPLSVSTEFQQFQPSVSISDECFINILKPLNEVKNLNSADAENASTKNNIDKATKHGRHVSISSNIAGDEVPFDEIALSVDHVREKIFSALDTRDLLNCRSLSSLWNSCANEQLHTRLHLRFKNYKMGPGPVQNSNEKSLKKLTTLLTESHTFPCTKFTFKVNKGYVSDQEFQDFVTAYGSYIQELTLSYAFKAKDPNMPHESVVMEQIKDLLLNKTSNISFLSLRIDCKVQWKVDIIDRLGNSRNEDSPLLPTDPEFNEIESQINCSSLKLIKSLKVLQLGGWPSAKLVELIIRISPNLLEFSMPGFNYQNLTFYLEPVNSRIRFLKELIIHPCYAAGVKSIAPYEKLALASLQYEGSLCLRKISLFLRFTLFDPEFEETITCDPEFKAKIVEVINIILKCSWMSLKVFELNNGIYLKRINWPEVLPNVEKLHLQYTWYTSIRELQQKQSLFPMGFDFSKTFPKLK